MKNNNLDRYLGFVFGATIGDVLGAPLEGLKSYQIEKRFGFVSGFIDMPLHPTKEVPKPQAVYRLSRTYTDDTQNILLSLEHLVKNNYAFDVDSYTSRFTDAYEVIRGMGKTTRKVLYARRKGIVGSNHTEPPGNGPILRCVPFVLSADDADFDMVRQVSGVTHSNFASHLAAELYSSLVYALVNRTSDKSKLESVRENTARIRRLFSEHDDKINQQQSDDSARLIANLEKVQDNSKVFSPEFCIQEIGTSSRVYQSLPVAVHSFLASEGYEAAVFNAINLGGDADSIGAFAGGLAGAQKGFSSIPERLKHIRNFDYIYDLTEAAASRRPEGPEEDLLELEERLTFEETAIIMHIKKKQKRTLGGIKTIVDGNEMREIARELGVQLNGPRIGEIKQKLRALERSGAITKKDDAIAHTKDLILGG
jgi:ADP-ribosyl-[dinitrogen reductase] hydrolase